MKISGIRALVSIFVWLIFTAFFVLIPAVSGQLLSGFSFFQGVPLFIRVFGAGSFSALLLLIQLILMTLIFGRVYCSFFCPLGAFQDFFIFLSKLWNKRKRKTYRKPLTLFRYGIFIIAVFSFLTVSPMLISLFEPFSFYGRIAGTVFRNTGIAAVNGLSHFLEIFHLYLTPPVMAEIPVYYVLTVLFSAFLLGTAAYFTGRIYCNTLCPLGTVLGTVSRFAVFKPVFDDRKCIACGLCEKICRSGCISVKDRFVDYSRCVVCFDCISDCPQQALSLKAVKMNTENKRLEKKPVKKKMRYQLDRKSFIRQTILLVTGFVAGLGLPLTVRMFFLHFSGKKAVLPPGAESLERFASRCTGCGLCMQACPTGVISFTPSSERPGAVLQASLDYDHSFCEYECSNCTQVCPAQALRPLTVDQRQHTKIGEVRLNESLCVVFDKKQSCGACAEHCPTGAVTMKHYSGTLFKPVIVPEYCIGCGHCEHVCPVQPVKAITVEGLVVHEPRKMRPEETEAGKAEAGKASEGSDGFAF